MPGASAISSLCFELKNPVGLLYLMLEIRPLSKGHPPKNSALLIHSSSSATVNVKLLVTVLEPGSELGDILFCKLGLFWKSPATDPLHQFCVRCQCEVTNAMEIYGGPSSKAMSRKAVARRAVSAMTTEAAVAAAAAVTEPMVKRGPAMTTKSSMSSHIIIAITF